MNRHRRPGPLLFRADTYTPQRVKANRGLRKQAKKGNQGFATLCFSLRHVASDTGINAQWVHSFSRFLLNYRDTS